MIKWFKSAGQYVKKYWIWFASGFGIVVVLAVVLALVFGGKKTEVVEAVEAVIRDGVYAVRDRKARKLAASEEDPVAS